MKYRGIIWPVVIFVVLSVFVITACEKKSRVNPFDPSSDTDFTPQNVQVAQSGVTTVTLTWELEDALIQGFKIDRKVGSGEWQTDYAVLEADAREWSDDDILPSNMYYYRLYGYADENVSEAIEVNINPGFPGPTDLDAQPYLVNQVKLTWTDVALGEAGYKIDKRVGSTGDWVIGYGETGADAEEWIDSSAVLDNILYYRVYAYIGELVSGYDEDSVNLSFPAPTNLTAVQESVKKVTLSWDDNSDGEDGFVIEKHTSTEEWIVYDNVAGDISQWSDSTLAMNTETFYRVHAYKDSDLSGTVSASITPVFPAPSNLQVILNELATITLSWNDNSVGEDGFRIDRQVDGGTWAEGYQTVGTDVKEWTDTNGIEMGKQYAYRVTAFTTDNMSAAAEGSITNVVPVPENVMISQPDVSTLRLTWSDSCAWETGFRIDKKVGDGIWEEGHVTLPPDTQQWEDTSPVLGQTHSYRIYTDYNTQLSNPAEKTILADIPPASNLTVQASSPSQIDLTWDDNANGEQGYKIERKVGATGTYTLLATLGANIESYSDTSVAQNVYYYKVYPYYGTYNSSQPVEGSFDMSEYGMPVVQTLEATATGTPLCAYLKGNVEDDGGYAVTTRGFYWGTSPSPTTNPVPVGSGEGLFEKSPYTFPQEGTYYVRAYATNTVGTRYGADKTVTVYGVPNIIFKKYVIENDNNDDGIVQVGESINFDVYVENIGSGLAKNLRCELTVSDSVCSITDSSDSFASLARGDDDNFNSLDFNVTGMPSDGELDFKLTVTYEDGYGTSTTKNFYFEIPVVYPEPDIEIDHTYDSNGYEFLNYSGDEILEVDKTRTIRLKTENIGDGVANTLKFTLITSDDCYISRPTIEISTQSPGQIITPYYDVTPYSVPSDNDIDFKLEVSYKGPDGTSHYTSWAFSVPVIQPYVFEEGYIDFRTSIPTKKNMSYLYDGSFSYNSSDSCWILYGKGDEVLITFEVGDSQKEYVDLLLSGYSNFFTGDTIIDIYLNNYKVYSDYALPDDYCPWVPIRSFIKNGTNYLRIVMKSTPDLGVLRVEKKME